MFDINNSCYEKIIKSKAMRIVLVIQFIVVPVWCLLSTPYTNGKREGTIFTITTFFDYEKADRWSTFCNGIDAILENETPATLANITRWVVVNEFSEIPRESWDKEHQ